MFSAGSCGFVGFCPCLVGCFIISLCMAFCGFGGGFIGFRSFRLAVALLVCRSVWFAFLFCLVLYLFGCLREFWRRLELCPFWFCLWPAVGFCSVSRVFLHLWRLLSFCGRSGCWRRFRFWFPVVAFGRGCSVVLFWLPFWFWV